jgi:hypothetical protein
MLMLATTFCSRPLRHADERDRRRQSDFRDLLAQVGGEHPRGTHLKPGIPGDAIDTVVIEAMDDLPHPLHGTAGHFRNDPIRSLADREHDDAGVTTVHGISPLSFQTAKLDLLIRAHRAYLNSVFHGDISRANASKSPWRCPIPNSGVQLRPNLHIPMACDAKVAS